MLGKTLSELYDQCCCYHSSKKAIIDGTRTFTFAEFREKALCLANALKGLNLSKGDRIAILLSNCAEVIFLDYALPTVGIVKIPLPAYQHVENLIFMIEETKACGLIYHTQFSAIVKTIKNKGLPELRFFIYVAPDGAKVSNGDLNLQTLISESDPVVKPDDVTENDLYHISYTGGTTGVPKGVIHTHKSAVSWAAMELMELKLGWGEVYMPVTPLTHAAICWVLPTMLRGGTCVILNGFDPRQFLETIEKQNVTVTFAVPTMIYRLLDYPDLNKYDTSSLRLIIYGAAPMSPERLTDAIITFGPVFTQLYAQTEVVQPVTILHPHEHVIDGDEKSKRRLASCGRLSLAMRMKLLDDQGNEVPPGEPGEIALKGPNIMIGYLNRPDLSAETLKDGWLHTGDIAKQDDEGYIYIVDRKKDMIISGGFNIYTSEIEKVLLEHPAVEMVAVIGIPHQRWGEEVKAIVKLRSGQITGAKELISFCKAKLGSVNSPKSIDFVNNIPVTGLGKIDKKALRAPYWAGKGRQVS